MPFPYGHDQIDEVEVLRQFKGQNRANSGIKITPTRGSKSRQLGGRNSVKVLIYL